MDGAAFAEHRILGRWFSGLVGGRRTRLSPWLANWTMRASGA
jgi:hypothetical protein